MTILVVGEFLEEIAIALETYETKEFHGSHKNRLLQQIGLLQKEVVNFWNFKKVLESKNAGLPRGSRGPGAKPKSEIIFATTPFRQA